MIVIIDYGMGNLRSVQKGIEKAGGEAVISSDPREMESSSGIILPGVGAFGRCMENLRKYDLVDTVKGIARSGKPFLGICLGLQLLFDESEEFGPVEGLGVLPGKVARFPESDTFKVPHMGWNGIKKRADTKLLEGINDSEWFYFVHSYYVVPEREEDIATVTDYGVEFVSSVHRGNLFASQFHPEKSAEKGLLILKNFIDLVGENE